MTWRIILLQVLISILYFTSLLAQEGDYQSLKISDLWKVINVPNFEVGVNYGLRTTWATNFVDPKLFVLLLAVLSEYKFTNKDAEYLIVNENKNWKDAMEYCKEKKRMQLVSFETQEKTVKFLIYLYKRDFLQSQKVHPNSPFTFAYWTSGNNLGDAKKFMWETANRPVEYFHWLNKQEDAPGGKGCILMGLKTFGRWTNASCETPNLFICEKPPK